MNRINIELGKLFNMNWEEDMTEEQDKLLDETADNLVSEYGWSTVFNSLMDYLQTYCTLPETAINAAHLFWGCGWYENPIPDPHDFLGYFYYRIRFDVNTYDSADILDSLVTTILPKNGFSEADLYLHPYYMPENDPKLRTAVDKWNIRFNNR